MQIWIKISYYNICAYIKIKIAAPFKPSLNTAFDINSSEGFKTSIKPLASIQYTPISEVDPNLRYQYYFKKKKKMKVWDWKWHIYLFLTPRSNL